MSRMLIASNTLDRQTTMPVAERLEQRGVDVILYEADSVFEGNKNLVYRISDSGITICYDGQDISHQSIDSAWYRRPGTITAETADIAKSLAITEEVKRLQDALWQQIPESRWLNAPERIKRAENKLAQLALAKTTGFIVPETVVSNSWDEILNSRMLPKLIMKMPRGILHEKDDIKAMCTTVLEGDAIKELLDKLPFPGIFQPYIPKAREWRVTVVGENVFEAAIYTSEEAKDDWRKHQLGPNVRFAAETLGDDIKEMCVKFLESLGLKFGAFDFIEDEDGRMVFLEVNPNGQFMWLEQQLGFPISTAIAQELLAIANSNR